MAESISVFLDRDRLPTAADWSQALHTAQFTVELTTDFDPQSHSGYVPCPDERCGFDYYVESVDAPALEFGEVGVQAIGTRNGLVTLRLSGRDADRAAAVAAAATLTTLTNGVLFDGESAHFIAVDQALAWARNENYKPLALYRRRSRRRRARLTPPMIFRLVIIATLVAAIIWLT